MKKAKLILAVLLSLAMIFALAACTGEQTDQTTQPSSSSQNSQPGQSDPTDPQPGQHVCQNVCPTCGKCTDANCTESVCADKCAGHAPAEEKLTITVNPASVEMNAGEDIDLMFGVSVSGGTEPKVIIGDDGGFDPDVEGVYTITYRASNKEGKTAEATRTVTVNKALSSLTLEVRKNFLGENKWQGNLISFENPLYVEINADTTVDTAASGVYHNTGSAAVKLNMAGSYGCSAIIDANGFVLEGRDGANSKLVNAQNPTRAGSSVKNITVNGEEVTVASAFAKELMIPAGGYAIIIQNGYLGTTADTDGRGYMNYNVIYEYGNVVRLYWTDTNEALTSYVNQAPTVSGNSKLFVPVDDAAFDLNTAILAGIVAKDDNGTFSLDDDITLETITLVDNGGFDVTKTGVYTVKLSVTDGKLTTEFTREVEVKSEGIATLTIGAKTMQLPQERIAIDKDLTGIGNYSFLVYTKNYAGTEIGFANGYGIAFVVDAYGNVVRIYDGANGKYYDATHNGVQDASLCTSTGYMTEAFASRTGDEIVIVAPNSSANNVEGGSRHFLNNAKTVGAKLSLTGLSFIALDYTFEINDKTFTAEEGKWALNSADVNADNAKNYSMLVYTKEYTGEVKLNGYGAAIVLSKYGQLVKIYDGANGGFYTEAGKSTDPLTFTTSNYATVAFSELQEGEILIIFPNDGGANAARGFALGLRTDGSLGKIAKLTNCTFPEKPRDVKDFAINDKTFTADEGKWALNSADVTDKNAASYSMIIYTKAFTGEVKTNGYGAAIVLDKYGQLVKIYDGANGGFYTEAGKSTDPLTFTTANYATVAFSELQEGETLIIFPNDGGANAARGFALGLRTDGSLGKTATLTGMTFEEAPSNKKDFAINDKTFTAEEGKWAVNSTAATADTAKNYSMIIYTKAFTGEVKLNGYGAAIVLDKYGKLVKIYDGANGGFYTEAGKSTDPLTFTTSNYATVAFSELQEGETLIIFPNDGGANAARGFALGLRTDGSLGKTATLTGMTFEEEIVADYVHIGDKTAEIDPSNVYINPTSGNAVDGLYVFTTDFVGKTPFTNGWGEAFVIKDGKIVRIYDGVNSKYYDAENTAGTADSTIAKNYMQRAIASLQAGEYVVIAPNAGSQVYRSFFVGNRTIGADFSIDGVEVTPSDKAMTVLYLNENAFCNPVITVNAEVQAANVGKNDFAIYSYGYNGIMVKNGWCEIMILDKDGKVIRIYDGVNSKYFDAENPNGVARTDEHFLLANMSYNLFQTLQPGETMIIGFNGGLNSNAGRAFLVSNRVIGAAAKLPVEVTASETPIRYASVTADGKTFFIDSAKVVVDAAHTGTPAFAVYHYGYTGTRYTGGYGVALIIDEATGKVVKAFDGTSGKYFDADNTSGVTGSHCTPTGYAEEAFQALEEGQYVLIAPNAGLTGNAARAFLLGYRTPGKAVSYALPV